MAIYKRISLFFSKYGSYLFLFSLFLIKIPPIYLFLIRINLLTSTTISRLIVVILSVFTFSKLKKNQLKKHRNLLCLFLIYLFFQSLSIINADYIPDFFQRYKDVVFPLLFLVVIIGYSIGQKSFIFILLSTAAINFFYQMFMFVFPNSFKAIASYLIYSPHYDLVLLNLSRSRLFVETFDEIAIPFIFLLLTKASTQKRKLALFVLLMMVVVPAFLSNFRTRIIMVLFSFLASYFFFYKKKVGKLFILYMSSFLLIIYFLSLILTSSIGYSFIDRFVLQNKSQDIKTIDSRIKNISLALEMAFKNPFFGVGLGNYYGHLPISYKIHSNVFKWYDVSSSIAITNPHDIFAQIISETGVAGFVFYTSMIIYFIVIDTKILFISKSKSLTKAFIISFWTLFLYGLFNPSTTLIYNSLFWILRIYI